MKTYRLIIQNTSQFFLFLLSYLVVFTMLFHSYLVEKDAFPLLLITGLYFLLLLVSLFHSTKKHYQIWATIFSGMSFVLTLLLINFV